MVTRRVIRISSQRKEAVAPSTAQDEKTSSAAVAVAVVDSLNNNDDNNLTKTQANQKPKALLCNHPSCTRRAQHPSPLCWMHCALARDVTCKYSGCNNKGILLGLCPDHGGLVQLCRRRGCINKANLEKRGGLCWMHQEKGEHFSDDDDSSSLEEDDEEDIRLCRFRGCISFATTYDRLCDMHSSLNYENHETKVIRAHPSGYSINGNGTKKRKRMNAFVIDLTDVPPQPPIPKRAGHTNDGASKFCFDKQMNIGQMQVFVEGKQRHVGHNDNEEEASVDYANALVTYRDQAAIDREKEQKELDKARVGQSLVIDLSDVPSQPPIRRSADRKKERTSKYTGVSFVKATKKWVAQITIDGKQQRIGCYDNEEDAANDYARALFKYKTNDRSRQQNKFIIDLTDVLPQPLILKNALSHSKEYSDNTRRRNVREGSSKYTGVYFEKGMKKWKAQIMIKGRVRSIGYYETEEEAAADYARAVFKYKPKRGYTSYGGLDLKDVPDQPLIHSDTNKSGFKGVKENKRRWEARLNGKTLGTFDTKEEAAGIYARARFYVDKGGEPPKKKKEKEAAVTASEESIDFVTV